MTRVWAIFKREFASYFNSLMAYFFIVVFLASVNMVYVWFSLFKQRTAVMAHYFEFVIIAFWIFIPAITMRMWSEERKSGTLELMMTMPIRDAEAVIAKFLAAFAFLGLTLLLSFISIPTLLAYLGEPDWGPIIGGYLGLLLLGGTFIAVGLAMSSMTENQFIAFLLTLTVTLILLGVDTLSDTSFAVILLVYFIVNPIVYVLTMLGFLGGTVNRFRVLVITNVISTALVGAGVILQIIYKKITPPSWLTTVENFCDAGFHFDSMARGVIDSRDVIYYLSVIAIFLLLNYRAVTARRWQ